MEDLARAQYAASKDPHDCALAYVALGRRGVLQGLFRSAGNKKVGGAPRRGAPAVWLLVRLVGWLVGCRVVWLGTPPSALTPWGLWEVPAHPPNNTPPHLINKRPPPLKKVSEFLGRELTHHQNSQPRPP